MNENKQAPVAAHVSLPKQEKWCFLKKSTLQKNQSQKKRSKVMRATPYNI
jgi:hypothetical protein